MIEEMEDLQETYSRTGTFKLGDRKERCDRLNGMVHSGHETVTCDALANYNTEAEAMRKVRGFDIATDWQDVPALVIRTISIDKIRFHDVGKEIVLAEGKIRIWKDREKIRKRLSEAMLAVIQR